MSFWVGMFFFLYLVVFGAGIITRPSGFILFLSLGLFTGILLGASQIGITQTVTNA